MYKGLRISEGDIVGVKVNGSLVYGSVLTAAYWGDEGGWYIEYLEYDEEGELGEPGCQKCVYWKQGIDGGTLEYVGYIKLSKLNTNTWGEWTIVDVVEHQGEKYFLIEHSILGGLYKWIDGSKLVILDDTDTDHQTLINYLS